MAKKTRVTIDLNKQDHRRLEQICELTGANTKADVVRDALRLFEYLAKQHDNGYAFQKTKGSEVVEVPLFALF